MGHDHAEEGSVAVLDVYKRQAEKALESIREDLQAGRYLKSEDIKSLTRQHQEQIRSFGDSAVHQMVDEARKRSESYWKGNERER